jgi:hypothetical protein
MTRNGELVRNTPTWNRKIEGPVAEESCHPEVLGKVSEEIDSGALWVRLVDLLALPVSLPDAT